jgi:hypothetical protein
MKSLFIFSQILRVHTAIKYCLVLRIRGYQLINSPETAHHALSAGHNLLHTAAYPLQEAMSLALLASAKAVAHAVLFVDVVGGISVLAL